MNDTNRQAGNTRRRAALAAAGLAALVGGCSLPIEGPKVDAVRHFTLGAPGAAAPAAEAPRVRPVDLAGHLRNRAMAVRVSDHEVVYLAEARWAEPLDEAITDRLRARLAGTGAGGTVAVRIQRCELVRGGENAVQLAATYEFTPAAGPSGEPGTVVRGAFAAAPRSWDGRDLGALVGLIRAAVDELGERLAAEVAGTAAGS